MKILEKIGPISRRHTQDLLPLPHEKKAADGGNGRGPMGRCVHSTSTTTRQGKQGDFQSHQSMFRVGEAPLSVKIPSDGFELRPGRSFTCGEQVISSRKAGFLTKPPAAQPAGQPVAQPARRPAQPASPGRPARRPASRPTRHPRWPACGSPPKLPKDDLVRPP